VPSRADGAALVERLLADPPRVHDELNAPPDLGVWLTERSCYELIAARCPPGARTLETGLGLSTVLFLLLGADHTCVVPSATQVEALRAYCRDRDIPTGHLRVELGPSHEVLPRLGNDDLDVVLLDGSHGFPAPMIDWFYGAARLRRGGVVVLDDRALPAVAATVEYLDADPRWESVGRTAKWVAYERLTVEPLAEDWYQQPFYTAARGPGQAVRRALRSLARGRRRPGQPGLFFFR
jgi:predicted O-methyltransferase YrrM